MNIILKLFLHLTTITKNTMKKFFIICATLITISLFLPFIKDTSLIELYSYAYKNWLNTDEIIKTIVIFLLWTWFLSIWYSKKVKISILWIIWALIYLYFYYKIFSSIWESISKLSDSYKYTNNLFWSKNTNDVLFSFIRESANQLSIWFYTIFLWFILNSFAIINIFKNLYKKSWNNKNIEEIEKKIKVNSRTWNLRI